MKRFAIWFAAVASCVASAAFGDVSGTVTFTSLEVTGGLNYETAHVTGCVSDLDGWSAEGAISLSIVASGSFGDVVTQRFDYASGVADFACDVTGLGRGEYYAFDAFLSVPGKTVVTTVAGTACARMTDNFEWIREDIDTYLGTKSGTGLWSGREWATNVASAGEIAVNAGDSGFGLAFVPSKAIGEHDGCEFRTKVRFGAASDELVDVSDAVYGITLTADDPDGDEFYFAVVSNGVWSAVSRDVYAPNIGVDYDFTFALSGDGKRLAYYVCDLSESPTGPSRLLAAIALDSVETPVKFEYLGTGILKDFEGDGYDSRLVEVSVSYDNVLPGTNFVAVSSEMTVVLTAIHATDKTNGTVRVNVRDSSGALVGSEDVQFSSLGSSSVKVTVGGLVQGDYYTVDTEVLFGGSTLSGGATELPMARKVEGWIDEDAATFDDYVIGTGQWTGTNGVSCVRDGQIAFIRPDWDAETQFEPTNDTVAVLASQAKIVNFHATFSRPGFYVDDGFPSVPKDTLASVTLACDDSYVTQFAVVSNGNWVLVSRDVFEPEFDVAYDLVIRLDEHASNIVYGVDTGGNTMDVLLTCPLDQPIDEVLLAFTGEGLIRDITGTSLDAHIAQVDDVEYWTLDEAVAAAGEGNLVPLWYSEYAVSPESGTMRLLDPNRYLNLLFKPWHHVTVTEGRKVRIYRWLSGNNWIEFADFEGVAEVPGGWIVNTAEGLSWLAAESTNRWLQGTVSLGADLDLASRNWTPISRFSGVFDGCGHCIAGLNNTNVLETIGAAGVYPSGPVNEWGRSSYGLFATVSNATVRNLRLDGVAVSNVADSVSAVIGILADGSLSVSNVSVASGYVYGSSGTVAGLIGSADAWSAPLTVVSNRNAAAVTAAAEVYGDPRWAAGIINVRGTETVSGLLVVTGNVNVGTVANTVYNSDNGGNVAQILAGSSWLAKFGEVLAYGNRGDGVLDAYMADHENWHDDDFPVCNLAAAVTRFSDSEGYRRFVEANDEASVPVDPVTRKARMLAGSFQNGATNEIGLLVDRISASENGGSITLPSGTSSLEVDGWTSLLIDRDFTFDLGGNTLYAVYDVDAITVAHGVSATVKNGTIVVGEGCEAFAGDLSGLVTNNVKVVRTGEDFWNRTVLEVDGCFVSGLELSEYLVSGARVELFEDSELTVDQDRGIISLAGVRVAALPDYRSISRNAALDGTSCSGTRAYVVSLNENALPSGDFEISGLGDGGTVSIKVTGAHAGLYYAVVHKASIVEEWSDPDPDDWVYVANEGSVLSFTPPAEDAAGFYTVRVTDIPPASGGDE